MKFRRSERLVDMTAYLLERPFELISFSFFTDRYQAAKSSISEDVAILKKTFDHQGMGQIKTYAGASGGVKYLPIITDQLSSLYMKELLEKVKDQSRILPGGYIYLTDILGSPVDLKKIGKIIASQVAEEGVDYVMTVATKGIPIAQAVAYVLNVPFIIARKDSKVTEGSTISVKYTSQSAPHLVQRMEVGRESVQEGSRILLVDDFLRGGGTMSGMVSLMDIFQAEIVGKYVLCENIQDGGAPYMDVRSILMIEGLADSATEFQVKPGSVYDSL